MKGGGRPPGRKGPAVLVVALLALLLAGAVLLQYSLDSSPVTSARWDDTSPASTVKSLLNVFGGLRESVAAFMWSKTDDIFHNYQNEGFDEEGNLYPYYWMILKLDPHFVMANYFASYMLCSFGKVKEGFDVALEGLRNNPDSPMLQKNLAEIYLFYLKNPAKARYHILKAIDLYRDPGDKEVVLTTLRVIDDILAGKKKIPMASAEKMRKLAEEQHRQEHEHEEDHVH